MSWGSGKSCTEGTWHTVKSALVCWGWPLSGCGLQKVAKSNTSVVTWFIFWFLLVLLLSWRCTKCWRSSLQDMVQQVFNSSHAECDDFLQEQNLIVMEWCIQFCQMAQCWHCWTLSLEFGMQTSFWESDVKITSRELVWLRTEDLGLVFFGQIHLSSTLVWKPYEIWREPYDLVAVLWHLFRQHHLFLLLLKLQIKEQLFRGESSS